MAINTRSQYCFEQPKENNGTLALRWNATDKVAIETYISSASSITDIGQLLNAGQARFGSRLTLFF